MSGVNDRFKNLAVDFDVNYDEFLKSIEGIGKNSAVRLLKAVVGKPLKDDVNLTSKQEQFILSKALHLKQVNVMMAIEYLATQKEDGNDDEKDET